MSGCIKGRFSHFLNFWGPLNWKCSISSNDMLSVSQLAPLPISDAVNTNSCGTTTHLPLYKNSPDLRPPLCKISSDIRWSKNDFGGLQIRSDKLRSESQVGHVVNFFISVNIEIPINMFVRYCILLSVRCLVASSF